MLNKIYSTLEDIQKSTHFLRECLDNDIFEIKKDQEKLQEQINTGFREIREKLANELTNTQEKKRFNWDNAPIICEINGYRWLLGPESDEEICWQDAKVWCESVGGELPPREILLMAYLNEDIRSMFETEWYWSSTEFYTIAAWLQYFFNGSQTNDNKTNGYYYVRAVKKVKITELLTQPD